MSFALSLIIIIAIFIIFTICMFIYVLRERILERKEERKHDYRNY